MRRSYYPALPDVTRYTTWEKVPDGLYTKTQLARLSPPRKPAKGAEPRGQVLYHGNCYAPLYALTDTILKRRLSAAQQKVLERARGLRYVCRLCGEPDSYEPLGKGRLCERCRAVRAAYRQHLHAAEHGRGLRERLEAGELALLTVDDIDQPRRLTLAGRGLHLIVWLPTAEPAAASPGQTTAHGQDAVAAQDAQDCGEAFPSATAAQAFEFITQRLVVRLPDLREVLCWRHPWHLRRQLLLRLVPDLPMPDYGPAWDAEIAQIRSDTLDEARRRAAPYPWLATPVVPPGAAQVLWSDLHGLFARWYGQPADGFDPLTFHLDYDVQPAWLEGGDPAGDVAALAHVLNRIAPHPAEVLGAVDQTASPRAPWRTCPHAITDLTPNPTSNPTNNGPPSKSGGESS